jgi:hypothetical protein
MTGGAAAPDVSCYTTATEDIPASNTGRFVPTDRHRGQSCALRKRRRRQAGQRVQQSGLTLIVASPRLGRLFLEESPLNSRFRVSRLGP